jgi:hypothetical protein
MKNKCCIIIIVVLMQILWFACSSNNRLPAINNETGYRITKITEKKSLFIIYAKKDSLTFKIISDKDKTITYKEKRNTYNCKNIVVGKSYELELQRTFPIDSIFGYPVAPNLGIIGLHTKDGVIKVNYKCHNSLYIARNLHGLCLTNIE